MRRYLHNFIALILIVSFIAPLALFSTPQKAEAQLATVEVNSSPNLFQSIASAISGAATSIATYSLQYKELVLDHIGWYLAKLIIRQLTTDIVNWINSGFDGNPAFVSDPAGFFIGIADQEIGKFIEGSSDLNFLCQPFSIDIRIALAFRYSPFRDRITCTFSDVINNAKNAGNEFNNSFIDGNFQQGGWKSWFTLTQEPQNNRIGAELLAQDELSIRIANKQARSQEQLSFGHGFLSMTKCGPSGSEEEFYAKQEAAKYPEGSEERYYADRDVKKEQHCEVVTPGSVIESGLENVMGSGVRQLELADEFNEIVNALFAQMLTQVLGGGGLKSVSGGGKFDTQATVNRLSQEQTPEDSATLGSIKTDALKGIDNSITQETTYKTHKEISRDTILGVKTLFEEARTCYQNQLAARHTPPLTADDISYANGQIQEITTTISQKITPLLAPILADIETSTKALITLNNTRSAITSAKTVNDTLDPTNDYQRIIQDKTLHDTTQIVGADEEKGKIAGTMTPLEASARNKKAICAAFPEGYRYPY